MSGGEVNLLAEKHKEHADWRDNSENMRRLMLAMQVSYRESCGKTLDLSDRDDYAFLAMLANKVGRMLSKNRRNPDDVKDICGYSAVEFNRTSGSEKIDIIIKEKKYE